MPASQRPKYLSIEHAKRFQDQTIVDNYRFRPPYPEEAFEILEGLITDEPRAVLDVGSGSGDIARRLVDRVERVDAVDFSLPMIEKGKTLPDGDSPKLHWIHAPAEDAPLDPPYALITAGQSIHWMDWDIVLPRFRAAMTPHGYLAVLNVEGLLPKHDTANWDSAVREIIKCYSTNPHYQPFDMIEEWKVRGLFEKLGEAETAPAWFRQPLEDYIAAFHSMSSLSREHIGADRTRDFDDEVRAVVSKYITNGVVEKQVYGTIVWGRPV